MTSYEGFGYGMDRGASIFMTIFYVILALIIGFILFYHYQGTLYLE